MVVSTPPRGPRFFLISSITEIFSECLKSIELLETTKISLNSNKQTECATQAAISLLGSDNCNGDIEPRLFSEDFSIMASEKPGCFVLMGNGTSEQHSRPLHANNYDFNDELLVIGSSY